MAIGLNQQATLLLFHFVKKQSRNSLFGRDVKQIERHIGKDCNPRRKISTGAFCVQPLVLWNAPPIKISRVILTHIMEYLIHVFVLLEPLYQLTNFFCLLIINGYCIFGNPFQLGTDWGDSFVF